MKSIKVTGIAIFAVATILLVSSGCKESEQPRQPQKEPTAQGAKIGMPAPELKISNWVKNGPVSLSAGKGKNIYVVEFWATWCPPCQVTIPHLTEVQKKYRDKNVIVVGITDEEAPLVKQFVAKMGPRMDYAVAIDDNSQTSKAYMDAFGIDTIPHAFIVDKNGQIVWHGNPMEGFDEALEQVVSGKFNIQKQAKRELAEKKLMQFIELVSTNGDSAQIDSLGKELEALDKEVGGIMPGRKFNTADMKKVIRFSFLMSKYRDLLFEGKPDSEIDGLAKEAKSLVPDGFNFDEIIDNLKLQKSAMDYFQAITANADEAKIKELGEKLGNTKCTNGVLLGQIAYAILTNEKITNRDVPLALKLAKSAYQYVGATNEDIVHIYAKALFSSGNKGEAIKYQKIAMDMCQESSKKAEFEKTLNEYKSSQ